MRHFLLICLAVYVVVFTTSFANTLYHDGDMLKAVPAVLVSEPWSMIFGSLAGDKMSHPEKVNSAIDDDSFSKLGCFVLAASGLINGVILFALWRLAERGHKRARTGSAGRAGPVAGG